MNDVKPQQNSDPGAPLDADDLQLLELIAEASSVRDPMPPGLTARSLFAVQLAELDADLMALEYVATPVAAVRSETSPVEARTITFTAETLTAMITLSATDNGRVRVDGYVTPAGPLTVELRQPENSLETTSDGRGRFSFASVCPGPASFIVRPAATGIQAMSTPILEL